MQKSQPFPREADNPVEPRLLEARLKFLWDRNSSGVRNRNEDIRGVVRGFRAGQILETFEALCCLIRKVDKRTLNAKSAFHTAA